MSSARSDIRSRRWFVPVVVVTATVAIIGGAATGLVVWRDSLPCQSGPAYSAGGGRPCPGPPPPSPTTLLAANTTFTVSPGQFDYFQFVPSEASIANLTGGFKASQTVAILVLTPSEFENYSAPPASFHCVLEECFTTGNVTTGEVEAYLPVYSSAADPPTPIPWYLVMQNMNATEVAYLTWTSSLVATYLDIYA